MSAMTIERNISPRDLGSIPRPVALVICDLVNNYDVPYRLQKGGGHVFLYNGVQGTRPWKISASRPAETSLKFLDEWIQDNRPAYFAEKEKAAVEQVDLDALSEALNTQEHPKPVVVPDPKPEPQAVAYVAPAEWELVQEGIESDGTTYRCIEPDCDYTRPVSNGRQGLHLHVGHHSGEMYAKGVETRALRTKQKTEMLRQAARVLAEDQGWQVVEPGESVKGLRKQNERLQAKIGKLEVEVAKHKREAEENKARLALINDAMKA